jgi:hypothetical protein
VKLRCADIFVSPAACIHDAPIGPMLGIQTLHSNVFNNSIAINKNIEFGVNND